MFESEVIVYTELEVETIDNDDDWVFGQVDKTIEITLPAEFTKGAEVATLTITIEEDDAPVLEFDDFTDRISENGGVSSVVIEANSSVLATNIPIFLSGTAVKGVDYTIDLEVVSIAADDEVTITVTAIDNGTADGDKAVIITLPSSLVDLDFLDTGIYTITLEDDDTP